MYLHNACTNSKVRPVEVNSVNKSDKHSLVLYTALSASPCMISPLASYKSTLSVHTKVLVNAARKEGLDPMLAKQ